jgi:hypothetical protein
MLLWIPLSQYYLTAWVRNIHRCPVGVDTVIDPHLGHNKLVAALRYNKNLGIAML